MNGRSPEIVPSIGGPRIALVDEPRQAISTGMDQPIRDRSRPRLMDFVIAMALFVSVWVVFGQTRQHAFVNYDDNVYVYDNPMVAAGLTWKGTVWAFTRVHACNWHPLTWMSHQLDCELYGLNPAGHHLTNTLLHAATAIALFFALRTMTGARGRSAFVALVFAIHPLRAESVAWIAERKDVLSGFFFALTLGAYVAYARRPWSLGRYTWVVVLFALGLLSKPMLVTVPLVLLLLDYWPLRLLGEGASNEPRAFWIPRRRWLDKLPLLGLSFASCAVTVFAQRATLQSFEHVPFAQRAGNAALSYMTYLEQLFWPAKLAVLYPLQAHVAGLAWASVGGALLLLAAVSVAAVALRHRFPALLAGWGWYLVALVPVIGFVQVGIQAHADRYTYLPHLGLFVAITWAAAEICARQRVPRALLSGVAIVMVGVLLIAARAQTSYWRDSEALWTHTLACTADNTVAHSNLGNAYYELGRLDDAIAQLQTVLQLDPHDAKVHNNLGDVLLERGRLDEAILHYGRAVELRPAFAEGHKNLGNALVRAGRPADAATHYETALRFDPGLAEAHYNLGHILLRNGNATEALGHFRRVLETKPEFIEVHNSLGSALLQEGRVDDAIVEFEYVLRAKPDNPDAHNNFGNAWLEKGRVAEALSHYRRALELRPNFSVAQQNLRKALRHGAEAARRGGDTATARELDDELQRDASGAPPAEANR